MAKEPLFRNAAEDAEMLEALSRDTRGNWHHKGAGSSLEPPHRASDFCLFSNLKEKLQSVSVRYRDNLISPITHIFRAIPQDELIAVYQNSMKRLRWVSKNQGTTTQKLM
jgi:hypothetical protein